MMSSGFQSRINVAEYENHTLNLLREVLTAINFQVEAVTYVTDAIAKIGSFDPDVVITDLYFGIPGSSGAESIAPH